MTARDLPADRSASETHPSLLPWFVAGLLDADRSAAVKEHLQGCAECREEAASLAAMESALRALPSGSHPTIEALSAWEEGAERRRGDGLAAMEEHLARCEECRSDLAALARSRAAGALVGAVAAPARRPEPAGARRERLPRRLAAAAAVVLLAAVGIAGWLWSGRSVAPSPEPGAIVLLPGTRAGEATPRLEGPGPWTVSVLLPFGAPSIPYRAHVATEGGSVVWDAPSPVSPSPDGRFSLAIPSLPRAAAYDLVVLAERGAPPNGYRYRFEVDGR